MRIGLFGGTFDPPHLAHLEVAQTARLFAQLDRVIWMTAGDPPLRQHGPFASALDRLEMTRLEISGNPVFEASGWEVNRVGTSYSVQTVRYLTELHPDDELFLILGGDSLRSFHKWREPYEILGLTKLLVFSRGGHDYSDVEAVILKSTTMIDDTPEIDISSLEIRKQIAAGKSIRQLIPDSVADYIRDQGLYQ